jgi:UbiA prenyltransferase family
MKALKILRVNEWWGYKVPMLLGVFIFFYDTMPSSPISILAGAGILLWWIITAAAFGYLINNVFDIEQDLLAGKPNFTAYMPVRSRVLLSLLLAIGAVSTWVVLYPSAFLFALSLVHLLLFILYSVPPIRLKERGYLGVLTDALYAFCLPVIISLSFAKRYSSKQILFFDWSVFIAIIWALTAGIRSILLHQFKDRKADRRSTTFNVVNAFGIRANSRIINLAILPVEMLCFYFLLFRHPFYPLIRVSIFTVYLCFITFTVTRFGLVWNFKRRLISMRFSPTQFYEGWFLLTNLCVVSLSQPFFLILIPVQIILFQNEVFQLLTRIVITIYSWIKAIYFALKRIFKPIIVNSWHHFLRPVVSILVNYSIFYFRRLVLRQTDTAARRPLAKWIDKAPQSYDNIDQKERSATRRIVRKAEEVRSPDKILTEDNRVVNGLWIGAALSNIEQLTVKSFLAAGHRFRIWVYEPVENVPEGAEVCDANTIIPESQIFRYKYANAFGHGKGSVSGFSDVFRYKLLYDEGGWWVDMDICCIHAFRFDTPYFFRTHHDLDMVGNIMKCPKGSQLMWDCYTEARGKIDENNTDWHKPIEILNRHIFDLDLSQYIFRDFSNEDKWGEISKFIFRDTAIPQNYVALHWMNEEWRSRRINKNDIRYNSTLGKLMMKYNIIQKPFSKFKMLTNDVRHILWVPLHNRLRE